MIKPLIEIALIAVVFGSVQGSALVSREVYDQAVRRLPIAAAAVSRQIVSDSTGLPVAEDRDAWPRLIDENSLGVFVSAGSALVIDRDNKKVLFEKDADHVRPIASLTKLMTVLVFFENDPDMARMVTIEQGDVTPPLSTIFAVGDQVSVRDLLFASAVGSANDAARALARASGMDQVRFVARMNEKARELGMMQTRFVEPTGLDARNVSTARDVAQLVRAARDIPLLREATQTPVHRTTGSTQKAQFIKTTDLLLSGFLNTAPYHIALAKTGSLDEAGYCFATSVDRDDYGIIVVVLGSENHFSRFEDAKALAYWAFTKWEWKP